MRRIIFCSLFFCFFASARADANTCAPKHYRSTIRHIESGGIGYDNGYTTFEAFLASDPGKGVLTPFIDGRGHIFNNGQWAANVGIGLRSVLENRVYGINTYYDYRNTNRSGFNQIGIGLESLGAAVDFRMNGYLPVGIKTLGPYDTIFGSFAGNFLLLTQSFQSAMKGVDAELGFHLGRYKLFDLYAAAGPYCFVGKNTATAWGGKARLVGTFNDILSLEISNSYDRVFHNKFQGQISLNYFFGPRTENRGCGCSILNNRMLQPVARQEIIVVDDARINTIAIDPETGAPIFFIFVNNTSNSSGTFESPYPTLAQAQNNSAPNNIIYVYPGDGTTTGMDSGITLKANQKFWGSGISHLIQTTDGLITIPAQSIVSPTITNTDIDTDGNAITLATNNAISGFTITSAINDAIYGTDAQNLDVTFCSFSNINTYAIESTFSTDASISISNNEFSNNSNGIFLTLNGTSNVICTENTFTGQTSVSSVPIEIIANNNTLTTLIENNLFDSNTTGSIRFGLNSVVNSAISILNNTMSNNGTGSQASLGSNIVVISSGTIDQCSMALNNNTFTGNTSNALYMHTSGVFTTFEAIATENTMTGNGGSGLIFATPTDSFTLIATENTITGSGDNGIAIISSGSTTTGSITINNNNIANIGNASNGIAINQDFSTLNLTIRNNTIDDCEGSGIISYAPTGIDSLTMNISDNTINNCQNMSSNAASGLDIEQYTSLEGTVTNNSLSGNTGLGVFIGSTLPTPNACLTLSGNSSSTDYLLSNPVDGLFNLSPCNVDSVNEGVINTAGTIDLVQSCSNPTPCPP